MLDNPDITETETLHNGLIDYPSSADDIDSSDVLTQLSSA
jgi:hypothetical protein